MQKSESKNSDKKINEGLLTNDQILDEEKAKAALHMRLNGADFDDIADALGVDVKQAFKWVNKHLKKARQENSDIGEKVLDLELARLDRMLQGLESRIAVGSSEAISSALRIQERRAKLLGLDKPTKIAPTTPDGKEAYVEQDYKTKLMEMMTKKASG